MTCGNDHKWKNDHNQGDGDQQIVDETPVEEFGQDCEVQI